MPVLKNWKTDSSTAHRATLGRYLGYAAAFALSLKRQPAEHYMFGQGRIRAGYPMVNFIALYISVGIIASLVVGAPVWWWQFRSERQKIEQFAPEIEELETIRPQVVELSNVRRELRGVREERNRIKRERDAFSATAVTQSLELSAYEQCQRDRDAARAQLRIARDRQEDIRREERVRFQSRFDDARARARRRLEDVQGRLTNLQQQYDYLNQQHRELATAHTRVEGIEERLATLQKQYDHVNQSYRELLAGNNAN